MDIPENLDLLLDLKHDLGKYLSLPLAMLPADATPQEIRQALHRALFETRTDRGGTKSAQQIWDAFLCEAETELTSHPGFARIADAVKAAFALERLLQSEDMTVSAEDPMPPLRREQLLQVMQNVSIEIMALIKEVSGE